MLSTFVCADGFYLFIFFLISLHFIATLGGLTTSLGPWCHNNTSFKPSLVYRPLATVGSKVISDSLKLNWPEIFFYFPSRLYNFFLGCPIDMLPLLFLAC